MPGCQTKRPPASAKGQEQPPPSLSAEVMEFLFAVYPALLNGVNLSTLMLGRDAQFVHAAVTAMEGMGLVKVFTVFEHKRAIITARGRESVRAWKGRMRQ